MLSIIKEIMPVTVQLAKTFKLIIIRVAVRLNIQSGGSRTFSTVYPGDCYK